MKKAKSARLEWDVVKNNSIFESQLPGRTTRSKKKRVISPIKLKDRGPERKMKNFEEKEEFLPPKRNGGKKEEEFEDTPFLSNGSLNSSARSNSSQVRMERVTEKIK